MARIRAISSALERWWSPRRVPLLRAAVAVMGVLAVLKLGDEFRRLLWETAPAGAIDLKTIRNAVIHWFGGQPVYREIRSAVYPPASYLLLWPFLGWADLQPTRWLWAITSLAALAWMTRIVIRASGADTFLERAFAALLFLSLNATGVTIGNGQLIVHLLPTLLAAILLIDRRPPGWGRDLLAASLFVVALAKPTISAPFLWIFLFVPGRGRPAALAVGGYAALTAAAAIFQPAGFWDLLQAALARGQAGAATGALAGSYANVHTWLTVAGRQAWNAHASLLLAVALAVWVYRHRRGDLWVLLGVSGLVARFWTYHRLYDDVLVVLSMVALLRITQGKGGRGVEAPVAGLVLAATILAMLMPARLRDFPQPWEFVYKGGHAAVWGASLIVLLDHARRTRRAFQRLSSVGAA
jgi:hypothetical protein